LAADRSLDLTCPGLAEPNSRLARVLAGQCLKFCDDTPSVATPHTDTGFRSGLFGGQFLLTNLSVCLNLSFTFYRSIISLILLPFNYHILFILFMAQNGLSRADLPLRKY